MRKVKNGITLVEVVVGAVILALTFGGLLAAFSGARAYVARAERRLTAANAARAFLNSLYVQVRQDTWTLGNNTLNAPTTLATWNDTFNRTYNRSYSRNASAESGREYRAIDMKSNYTNY